MSFVSIVGAGPGDPELLTLRAARLIDEADDLVVDALVPPALYRGSKARVIHVGKRAGRPRISQEEIGRILVRLARDGRKVVRLKGGDPGLFGRVAEEIRSLEEAGVPYEIVAGVTSALAAPAAAGIPVTDRELADRVVILTGHRRSDEYAALPVLPPYHPGQTVVLLMGFRHLRGLVEQALALGYPPDLPAAVIGQATLPGQRFVANILEHLPAAVAAAGLETPATIVLGQVASHALSQVEEVVGLTGPA